MNLSPLIHVYPVGVLSNTFVMEREPPCNKSAHLGMNRGCCGHSHLKLPCYIFFILGLSGGVGASNGEWKHDMGNCYCSVKVEKSFIASSFSFWYANFCTSTGWKNFLVIFWEFSHMIFMWKWTWNQVDVNIHTENTLTYSYNVTYSFSACHKDTIKNIKNY